MTSVKVKMTGIEWDTDGQKIELPSEMTVEVEREEDDDDQAVFDAAVDKASDQTGWCINCVSTSEIVE